MFVLFVYVKPSCNPLPHTLFNSHLTAIIDFVWSTHLAGGIAFSHFSVNVNSLYSVFHCD